MRLLTKDEEQRIALSLEVNSTGRVFPIRSERGFSKSKDDTFVVKVEIHPGKDYDILTHVEDDAWGACEVVWQDTGTLITSQALPFLFGSALGSLLSIHRIPHAYEKARRRGELESVIRRLVMVPFGNPESGKISPEVAITAHELLALLPDQTPLPRVGPDHERGLLLAWENTSPELIATLREHSLHFVVNPGTPDALYFDDLPFTGDQLPAELLKYLPKTRA
jgi:hypothetical protein